MGGSIPSPIQAVLQRQQPTPQPGGANYQAPPSANLYRPQQMPYQVSPFVQQQMQRMQQMPPQIRGLGQQQYVSPLQSMLSRVLSGYNPQVMMQQGMPNYGGPIYRPNIAQAQQNLGRVSPPVRPPAPAPEPAPEANPGGGGE